MYLEFPISFPMYKLKIRPDRQMSSYILGKLPHERQTKATNYITKQSKSLVIKMLGISMALNFATATLMLEDN